MSFIHNGNEATTWMGSSFKNAKQSNNFSKRTFFFDIQAVVH